MNAQNLRTCESEGFHSGGRSPRNSITQGEIALEALLDGKGMGGERRVVRMRCAGWFGHRCTLKTIPNLGYLLYRGTRLQRAAHREGVFHRMVKRKRRTNEKRTSSWAPVQRNGRVDAVRKSYAARRGQAVRKRKHCSKNCDPFQSRTSMRCSGQLDSVDAATNCAC